MSRVTDDQLTKLVEEERPPLIQELGVYTILQLPPGTAGRPPRSGVRWCCPWTGPPLQRQQGRPPGQRRALLLLAFPKMRMGIPARWAALW